MKYLNIVGILKFQYCKWDEDIRIERRAQILFIFKEILQSINWHHSLFFLSLLFMQKINEKLNSAEGKRQILAMAKHMKSISLSDIL